MNIPSTIATPQNTASDIHAGASKEDKTRQFVGQVLPASLGLGAQALSTTSVSASAGAVSAAAAPMSIVGGVLGIANIAMSWGRSTPAAGATSGAAAGAAIGTMIAPGVGTAIGAALGSLVGGLLGSIKTGKHKDQVVRDQVRGALVERGILDSSFKIALADGSKYDVGIDGGPKAEFGGRRPFEIDFNHPFAKYAVSWLNPVIALMSQGNQKVHADFVGYFANAALSNAKSLADVRDNVNAIIKQFGVSDEALFKTIVSATKSGQLDSATAAAWVNGMKERRELPEVGKMAEALGE